MNHVRNMAKTDSDDLVIPMDMEAMDTSADRPQFVLCHSKKMSSKHAAGLYHLMKLINHNACRSVLLIKLINHTVFRYILLMKLISHTVVIGKR